MNDTDLITVFHNRALMYPKDNDEQFRLQTDYVPLNRRIYIFEDIDAECDIIHQRAAPSASRAISKGVGGTSGKNTTVDADASDDDMKSKAKIKEIRDENVSHDMMYKNMLKRYLRGPTLSGILNALDGVLEIRGAVIIMTTNFPEKLDSAFIRPCRITMSLEMRPMRAVDAAALITAKYGAAALGIHTACVAHAEDDSTAPDWLPRDGEFTPAMLESFCQIASDIHEFAALIEKHRAARK
jgi:hypothetical protein